jgi:hypothetical protein
MWPCRFSCSALETPPSRGGNRRRGGVRAESVGGKYRSDLDRAFCTAWGGPPGLSPPWGRVGRTFRRRHGRSPGETIGGRSIGFPAALGGGGGTALFSLSLSARRGVNEVCQQLRSGAGSQKTRGLRRRSPAPGAGGARHTERSLSARLFLSTQGHKMGRSWGQRFAGKGRG